MSEGVDATKMLDHEAAALAPYVARFAAEWDLDGHGAAWREIDATCCYVDISGFTTISERLSRLGRLGSERLTDFLDGVFANMLVLAGERGGSLLKFGGDSLLLVFTRGDHAVLAADAAVAMREALVHSHTPPSGAGRLSVRSSIGVHTGRFHCFAVGRTHRELLLAGPAATETIAMEQQATAGVILVSQATAARLPSREVGEPDGRGRRLRKRRPSASALPFVPRAAARPEAIARWVPVGLRDWLVDRRGGSEHRLASVAFIRFQGVDELLEARGPEATAHALDAVVVEVQAAAEAEGLSFFATDIDAGGGTVIVAAGVPSAKEDDEGRILRASRAILDADLELPLQIGVNRDHVFAGDVGSTTRRTFTVMGDGVNVAARLAAAADVGSALATGSVLDGSRTDFATTELDEPLRVKGKAEPLLAWRVESAIGVKAARFGFLPFRGREEELAALREAAGAAASGEGRIALVEGERGAGKTRLLAELSALGIAKQVLTLQGEPFGRAIPYLPLRGPLRGLLGIDATERAAAGLLLEQSVQGLVPDLAMFTPLLGPVVDAEMASTPQVDALADRFIRARVVALVVALLEALCPDSLLVVAEDAHWFDDSTAEVLAGLAEQVRHRPWLLCATRRLEEGGFVPSEPDVRLTLEPLSDDVARDLVDLATEAAPLRPQERDRVVSQASGNPLFLEELLRIVRASGSISLPDSLDAIAMREIDALPGAARRGLLVASVLGSAFDRDLVESLVAEDQSNNHEDPLAGLSEILLPTAVGQLRFRHALLQESAYQSLPFRERTALHRRAGIAIEASRRTTEDAAALLSLHFHAAQDWPRAWRYGRLAAKTSLEAHAPTEAAVHLERAVTAGRHLDDVSDRELAAVLSELGDVEVVMGVYERADETYRRAAHACAEDPVERARIAGQRAYLRTEYQGRLAAAVRQVRAGLALLDGVGSPNAEADRVRARLVTREAVIRYRQGRLAQAIRLSEEAVRECETVGHQRTLALALSILDQALAGAGRADEATNMERALAIYEDLGYFSDAAMTLGNLGAISFYRTDWVEAADFYQRSIDAATNAGDLATAAVGQTNLGELVAMQGDLRGAVELLTPALRTLDSFGYRAGSAQASMHLGRARALLGDLGPGVQQVNSAIRLFSDAGIHMGALEAKGHLAEVLVLAGSLDEATRVLADARTMERALGDSPISSLLDRVEITALVASGDLDAARGLLDAALERARTSGAIFELFVLLALGSQMGGAVTDAERTSLSRALGIVSLDVLP
jgi:class 3 adenylate cyclase/tetratricopeptide (TPR) repeat protein